MSHVHLRKFSLPSLDISQIQPDDDRTRLLADRATGRTKRDVNEALKRLAAAATLALSQISVFLVRFQMPEIMHSLLASLGADFEGVFDDLQTLHDIAGQAAMDGVAAGLTFDRLNALTVAQLRGDRDLLIKDVSGTVSEVVADTIAAGLQSGATADQVASAIAQTIGLNVKQARAVLNYRRLLEKGDVSGALARQLRDRRFDAATSRMAAGSKLGSEKIDIMVQRYAERLRDHRAETIARTETRNAAVRGKREAWRQMAVRNVVDAETVTRFWMTAADELVCPWCSAIPTMNPDGVPLDGRYASPTGPVGGPEEAHPRCRCSERVEANFRSPFTKADPYHDERGRFAAGPVTLSGDELGPWSSMKDLRDKAKRFAERFIGKRFTNYSTGHEIVVTKKGVKHTVAGSGDRVVRSVPAIPDLLRRSTLISSSPDSASDHNILAVEIYSAPLTMDGKAYRAILTVKQHKDARRYYDHGVIE